MEEEKVKKQALSLLQRHLQIQPKEPLGEEVPTPGSLQELREKLSQLIGWLLDHDFQRLLNAVYRVDVPESRFKEVLANPLAEKPVAVQIAELVLERELQKVRTRMLYSSLSGAGDGQMK